MALVIVLVTQLVLGTKVVLSGIGGVIVVDAGRDKLDPETRAILLVLMPASKVCIVVNGPAPS